MIKLFEVNDQGIPEISTEARTIQVFKKLITRDKGSDGDHDGRKKHQATKELAFIYFYAKFDSPYDRFDDDSEKIDEIKKAVGLLDNWKLDSDVKEAIKYFQEIQKTKSMIHLESVENAVNSLSSYLRGINIDERIDSGPKKGELVHDINKVKSLAKEMPDMLEALQKTKELVKKEMAEEAQLRSGRKLNKWTEG